MNNDSLNIFLRLVQENIYSKKVQADQCNSAAEDLARALSIKDQPNWLKEIIR
ncbi:hypothetical protein [uncultured Paraglaciecola sp.]|mgnify:CR=1 FL=1|uniref:hypothetical protein n=1 Tax=uncultured Paraglaciecola sp. TaxID=1765024 RepID=UPI00261E2B89|nr:hypothetical protein [uncultured Paraglaciecola sp.]